MNRKIGKNGKELWKLHSLHKILALTKHLKCELHVLPQIVKSFENERMQRKLVAGTVKHGYDLSPFHSCISDSIGGKGKGMGGGRGKQDSLRLFLKAKSLRSTPPFQFLQTVGFESKVYVVGTYLAVGEYSYCKRASSLLLSDVSIVRLLESNNCFLTQLSQFAITVTASLQVFPGGI